MLGIPQQAFLTAQRAGSAGEPAAHLYDDTQLPAAAMLQLSPHRHVDLHALAQRVVRRGQVSWCPFANGLPSPTRCTSCRSTPKDVLSVSDMETIVCELGALPGA